MITSHKHGQPLGVVRAIFRRGSGVRGRGTWGDDGASRMKKGTPRRRRVIDVVQAWAGRSLSQIEHQRRSPSLDSKFLTAVLDLTLSRWLHGGQANGRPTLKGIRIIADAVSHAEKHACKRRKKIGFLVRTP